MKINYNICDENVVLIGIHGDELSVHRKGDQNMEQTYREQLMDQLAGRLQRKAIRYKMPIEEVIYDTDEAGKKEWIHLIYKGGYIAHIDISGMQMQQAMDLCWEKMQQRR